MRSNRRVWRRAVKPAGKTGAVLGTLGLQSSGVEEWTASTRAWRSLLFSVRRVRFWTPSKESLKTGSRLERWSIL